MGRPLVVDLDGTLSKLDSLHESALSTLAKAPLKLIQILVLGLFKGRAWVKAELAAYLDTDISHEPYNSEVLELIRKRKTNGDLVVLATGANQSVAQQHSGALGEFAEVLSSDRSLNLTGNAKAQALVQRFGEGGYDYVGNSTSDIVVWRYAHTAYVVSGSRRLIKAATKAAQEISVIHDGKKRIPRFLAQLRPHQWVKNLLVFVPFLLSHEPFSQNSISKLLLAFAAFSLVASAVYVINDLFDRGNDRKHSLKKSRPIAAGLITVPEAIGLSILLLSGGAFAALYVSPSYLGFLGGYFLVTTIYTFWGKRQVVLDVVLLAMLYTSRVFGGMLALDLEFSFWLFSFSIFTFLSLAFLKRFSELLSTKSAFTTNRLIAGRGYGAEDQIAVSIMGIASSYTAALILALYLNSAEVSKMYLHPNYLWFMLPVFVFWFSRIWILGFRGLVDSDPVFFAVRDRITYVVAALTVAVFVLSTSGILYG